MATTRRPRPGSTLAAPRAPNFGARGEDPLRAARAWPVVAAGSRRGPSEPAPVANRIATSPVSTAVKTVVQSAPATFTLARHKAQPVAASIARLTITATSAYLLAGVMP